MDDLMQVPVVYLDEGLGAFYWPQQYKKDVGFTALYTAEQMREYAKQAVEAERANRPYWLCCGGIDPQVHRRGCIEAQSGHPERCVFGTASEHSAHR